MICFIGDSHAPEMLRKGAKYYGLELTDDPSLADLVFISQDTPTDEQGSRDLEPIRKLVAEVRTEGVLVLTSQVPVGFTRSLKRVIYHQAETLRIKDAFVRAIYPEQHIVGCLNPANSLPPAYLEYLDAFRCPVVKMSLEEAEFSKIAINLTLISQVENTNRLFSHAEELGVDWDKIKPVLKNDKRIGQYSYLTPGNWRDSKHLLRDWVTFHGS